MGLHTGTPRRQRRGMSASTCIWERGSRGVRPWRAGAAHEGNAGARRREVDRPWRAPFEGFRPTGLALPTRRWTVSAIKTIANTNLPRPASWFVGREREVSDVLALVREGARLVTLTGAGGSGKTRLAIETATELIGDFANGVYWIQLADIREPSLVMPEIAQTVGASGSVAESLAGKRALDCSSTTSSTSSRRLRWWLSWWRAVRRSSSC